MVILYIKTGFKRSFKRFLVYVYFTLKKINAILKILYSSKTLNNE